MFASPPPTVTSESAISYGPTIEVLSALVTPNGADTTVTFDYGATSGYGSTSYSLDIGSGSSPVLVQIAVPGLTLGNTYHYRASATNSTGTTNGTDATFTTILGPVSSGLLGQLLLGKGMLGASNIPLALASAISASAVVTADVEPGGATAIASNITASATVTAANHEAATLASSITPSLTVTANNAETVQLACAITASATVTATSSEKAALASAISSTSSLTAASTESATLAASIAPSAP